MYNEDIHIHDVKSFIKTDYNDENNEKEHHLVMKTK